MPPSPIRYVLPMAASLSMAPVTSATLPCEYENAPQIYMSNIQALNGGGQSSYSHHEVSLDWIAVAKEASSKQREMESWEREAVSSVIASLF